MNTALKERIHDQFEGFEHFKRERLLEGMDEGVEWKKAFIELTRSLGKDSYKYNKESGSGEGVIRLAHPLPMCLRKDQVYVKSYFSNEFDQIAVDTYIKIYEDNAFSPVYGMESCMIGGNDQDDTYIEKLRFGYINNEQPCMTEMTICSGDFRYYSQLDKYMCPEIFRKASVLATGFRTAAFSDKKMFSFKPTAIFVKIDAVIAALIDKYGEDVENLFYYPEFVRSAEKDEEYRIILEEKKCMDSYIQGCRESLLRPGTQFEAIVYCEKLEYKIGEKGTVCIFKYLNNLYKAKLKIKRTFSSPNNFCKTWVQVKGNVESNGKIYLERIVLYDVIASMELLGCTSNFAMRFSDQPKHIRDDMLEKLQAYKDAGGNMKMLGMQKDESEKIGTVLGFAEAKDAFLLAPEVYPEVVRGGVHGALKRIDRGGGQRTANQNVVSAYMSIPYDSLPREPICEKELKEKMNGEMIACEAQVSELISSYNAGESAVILDGKNGTGKITLLESFAKHTGKEIVFFPTTGNPQDNLNCGSSRGFENGSEGTIIRSIIQRKGDLLLVFEDCDKAKEEMLAALADLTKGYINDLFLEASIPLPNKTFVAFVAEDASKLPDYIKRGVSKISMPEYSKEEKAKILVKIANEKGCCMSTEVIDYLVESSLENGVEDLLPDLNKLIAMNRKNISLAAVKSIWNISDEFSFPFYASTESLIRYFRFHQEEYSDGLRAKIKQSYSKWQEDKEEHKKWNGQQLGYMIRIRDCLPEKKKMTQGMMKILRSELNKSHYGMETEKQAIMKAMIAVENSKRVKALIFVGPPGCGKTSFLETLGGVFDRSIQKITCTGLTSVSQLCGVSGGLSTAKMGDIAKALCEATTTHSILLFDEIDKVKEDSSVLNAFYSLLDGNENGFWDNGLETYIDVSNVLFCFTANSLEKIPSTILDRCEIIQMHSYTSEEKAKIAEKHALPAFCRSYDADVKFTQEALTYFISDFCVAPGARDVYRNLEGLFTNMILNDKSLDGTVITPDDIKCFCSPAPIREDWFPKGETPMGCVRILATSGGAGCLSAVQISKNYVDNGIRITGNVGETTKESVTDALNLCGEMLNLEKVPPLCVRYTEGGVKKEGFSAGCANFVAGMSYFLKRPVNEKVAMTGEIDVGGSVYAIGGVEEKLQAALDYGLQMVFLPEENYRMLKEQDRLSRFKGLTLKPVKFVTEILDEVFGTEWKEAERH